MKSQALITCRMHAQLGRCVRAGAGLGADWADVLSNGHGNVAMNELRADHGQRPLQPQTGEGWFHPGREAA